MILTYKLIDLKTKNLIKKTKKDKNDKKIKSS